VSLVTFFPIHFYMGKNVLLLLVLIFFMIATSLAMSLFIASVIIASERILLLFWTKHIYTNYNKINEEKPCYNSHTLYHYPLELH
jgi:positive regulator of sigma E activity